MDKWVWQWAARSNIPQISYIPQTEQHSPLILARAASSRECNYYLLAVPYTPSMQSLIMELRNTQVQSVLLAVFCWGCEQGVTFCKDSHIT